MSFVSRPTLVGRAPSAQRTLVAFGDISFDPRTVTGATTATSGSDAITQLQRQLNRYTLDGGAPVQFRVGAQPIETSGVLDQDTCTRCVWLMQLRAGMANIQWNDGASQDLLNEAMAAWTSPCAFVTKNLQRVTSVLKLFGDKNKIPPAKSTVTLTPSVIAGVVTASALAFIFLRRHR